MGTPTEADRSMILWIFSAKTSPRAPPNTVKSWLNRHDPPSVDGAEAGDHPVGVRAVVVEAPAVGPVAGQHVELLEGALVEEVLDPLSRRHLALGVLALHRPGRSSVPGLLPAGGELLQALGHRMLSHVGQATSASLGRAHRAGPVFLAHFRDPAQRRAVTAG